MCSNGSVDDQITRLMLNTLYSTDSRSQYAQAATLAAAEARRVAWFSPAWFDYKLRARYYRKCAR